MDFHILIVIACVFLLSLFSSLFINKFYGRGTFEQIAAEKKAMSEKIYGHAKLTKKQAPRSKVTSKKDQKTNKQKKGTKVIVEDTQTEIDDSDGHSELPILNGNAQTDHNEKPNKKSIQFYGSHTEIGSESESLETPADQRRSSAENINQKSNKVNKQRKGILNKTTNNIQPQKDAKEIVNGDEALLNNYDIKVHKDNSEHKKIDGLLDVKKPKDVKKSNKIHQIKKENIQPTDTVEIVNSVKEIKQVEKKLGRTGSPKPHGNKTKYQNKKKNDKDALELDKISDNDTIGVNLLMNFFSRAELNRSEIQILIDYLLNKQLDMPENHAEWSDDIVQKLKKQLEEKEKALEEEQKASLGIQAKLRELRAEINCERIQMNANIKGYQEEIQSRKSDIVALNQEIQILNEKFANERKQLNKIRLEKQTTSQDILMQLNREKDRISVLQAELVHKEQAINELKAEIAHKDQCINDLKCLVNASQQGVEDTKQKTNEIIQTQVNQIHVLEQKLDEAEVLINEQRYALEKVKNGESEHEVELRNLQNALDSKQSEVDLIRNELGDKQQEIDQLKLNKQELFDKINEMQRILHVLENDSQEHHKKAVEYEATIRQMAVKESELTKDIQERFEKNNQQQKEHALLASQSQQMASIQSDAAANQKRVHEILERLYPEAVAANAVAALSLSVDQWIQQVLVTHVEQTLSKRSAVIATNTICTNTIVTNSNSSSNHSTHNHNNLNDSEDTQNSIISSNVNSGCSNNSDGESSVAADQDEIVKLRSQNAQLKANKEELTKLVTKTSNTLQELEARAREQDEYWQRIVRSKEEEIHLLKHSNGEKQDI